ncbi:MAG: 2-hydroxyacid dehydrogenase [candidate division WOR-3 bacterium]
MKVLVSFNAKSKHREIINQILSGYAEVFYKENEIPLEGVDILITLDPKRELGAENIGRLKSLKFLQCVYAGVEHLPYKWLPESVIIAGNFGAYSVPIAEHVLAMILDLAKRLTANHIKLSKGIYDRKTYSKMLRGKTVGILGFGGIGKEVARVLKPFDVRILAINRSGKTDFPVDFIGTLKDLDYILRESDILVISLPLTKHTYNLITSRELSLMKSDAILINVARAHIVNERDLYEHLVKNPNFQAGFDVWWREPFGGEEFKLNYPFFDLENFLGSPHNSNIVPGMFEDALKMATENVLRFIKGEGVKNLVNREDYV